MPVVQETFYEARLWKKSKGWREEGGKNKKTETRNPNKGGKKPGETKQRARKGLRGTKNEA